MRGALVFVGASLSVLGSAPGASAHAQEIGTSPATRVVAQLPQAVSVTFDKPIRTTGFSMHVVGRDGLDYGAGAPSVFRGTTLRRDIRIGSPNGPYQISWEVVAADGAQESGTFGFVAAHGNGPAGAPAATGVPTAPVAASTAPAPTASTASTVPARTGAPAESARASASSVAASPSFIQPSTAALTPQTDPHADSGLRGALGEGSDTGDGGHSRSLFTYLPLGLGAVLVIAAGLVSLITRRRNATADSEQDRSPLTR